MITNIAKINIEDYFLGAREIVEHSKPYRWTSTLMRVDIIWFDRTKDYLLFEDTKGERVYLDPIKKSSIETLNEFQADYIADRMNDDWETEKHLHDFD